MRTVIVQKYGGTSVANPRQIQRVAQRVVACKRRGHHVVVVVSALGDTTDELLDLARQVSRQPPDREIDMLISTGEQVSVALLAMAVQRLGVPAISFTGAQVGILTDRFHTQARIIDINTRRIRRHLRRGAVVIVAGFQGVNLDHEITTLGRGGSDLTAVALAKSLHAAVCEIYTDVDGVYTADPRIEPQAVKLAEISYDEMLELASLGAQVMQARSVELGKKFHVPIHVRSSVHTGGGTMITRERRGMEDILVRGVTVSTGEAKVTVQDVPDRPGVAAVMFRRLAAGGVNVDMIVQNVSRTGFTDVSFTVPKEAVSQAERIIRQVDQEIGAGRIQRDERIAKISVVGLGMRGHSGVAAKMFEALAAERINIHMISTSEIKISCIIGQRYARRAVRAIHKRFGLARRARRHG